MGINDSINTVSKLQFKNIIKYKSMYLLKDEVKDLYAAVQTFFNLPLEKKISFETLK